MIKISELEETFREIFDEEEGLVKSIETIYEIPDGDNVEYYKLIISLHGLTFEDVSIIHTKFIFKVDLGKVNVIEDSFLYLFGLNCNYHRIEFDSILDMAKRVEDIIKSNNFGPDMQILSDFIEAPSMFLNYYMRRADITDYSIFDVKYDPKFKTVPCSIISFDFDININNNYNMDLSIQKIDHDEEDGGDIYKFQFQFMDETDTRETDTLENIHFFIGSVVAEILDKKLKNK